jgi:hypothetical protein
MKSFIKLLLIISLFGCKEKPKPHSYGLLILGTGQYDRLCNVGYIEKIGDEVQNQFGQTERVIRIFSSCGESSEWFDSVNKEGKYSDPAGFVITDSIKYRP